VPKSDPLERARLYWSQSRLHLVRGENDLAARYARLTIAAVEQTEHEHYAARARHLVASVALEQGDPEGALEQLLEGLPLIEQSGDRFLNGLFRVEIARALLQLQRPEEAGRYAAQAADLLEGVSRVDMARARLSLAMVLAQTGDEDAALEMFAEIAAELVDLRSPLASQAFTAWSNLLSEAGDTEGALEVLRRAVLAQTAEPSRE
jgi:ATP/maltotriose-dependent transcriptional regulator MalT